MPSLRKRIYTFLALSLVTILIFLCVLGYVIQKASIHTDTKNMMVYYGLFIEENALEQNLANLQRGGLIAAYHDVDQLPSYIREAFPWNSMNNEALYEQELTNLDNGNVYVYALKYRLKDQRGDVFIISEYLDKLEEQMQYDHSLWYENTLNLLIAGSILLISMVLIFLLFYYILVKPIRAMSLWLSNPTQPISYEKIKYRELIVVVQSYENNLEKQKEIIEKEELFLSTMSHELRTPIAIISSSVELLDRLAVEDKISRINCRISYAITNMNYLVKTLLWLSRKNNQPLSQGKVDLSELIYQVIKDNQYLLEGRDTETSIKCNIEPEYNIQDNYGAVHLAIVNLIRNALQYSADGQIVVALEDGVVTIENPYEKDFDQANNAESYGYGLYLVEKICVARGYLFTIEYQSKNVVATLNLKC
ncbi:sensor histidine kinase [Vibrio cortegadensis]|uniref:histidine kinase n=1 Tax=Vibrio cortegadensis TaxID=1328770 RepID=A0ABV4M3I1_9VIBR